MSFKLFPVMTQFCSHVLNHYHWSVAFCKVSLIILNYIYYHKSLVANKFDSISFHHIQCSLLVPPHMLVICWLPNSLGNRSTSDMNAELSTDKKWLWRSKLARKLNTSWYFPCNYGLARINNITHKISLIPKNAYDISLSEFTVVKFTCYQQ